MNARRDRSNMKVDILEHKNNSYDGVKGIYTGSVKVLLQ